MFTFADVPVKYVALLLAFAFCTVWSAVELRRGRTLVHRISTGLHLVMAVVMVLMVSPVTWFPLRQAVGFAPLLAVFALGTLWFVILAVRERPVDGVDHRLHFVGHAAMFGAMTWHLAGMAARMQAMIASGAVPAGGPATGGHGMGAGMPPGMASASAALPVAFWVAVVGVPFMLYLLVSGLVELWRSVAPLAPAAPHVRASGDHTAHIHATTPAGAAQDGAAHAPTGPGAFTVPDASTDDLVAVGCSAPHALGGWSHRLSAASAAAMNLGMFWMSTGLMRPVAPWLDVLSF